MINGQLYALHEQPVGRRTPRRRRIEVVGVSPYKVLLERRREDRGVDVFRRRLSAGQAPAKSPATDRVRHSGSRGRLDPQISRSKRSQQAQEADAMADTAELNSLQPLLIKLLLEKEILTPEQVGSLNEARTKLPGLAGKHPGQQGLVMGQHIAEVYADYLMVPLFDMAPDEVDPRLAGLLPEKLCREHLLVPVELHEDTLDVAFATFEDMLMVDELQLLDRPDHPAHDRPAAWWWKRPSTCCIAEVARSSSAATALTEEEEEEDESSEMDQTDERF